MINITNDFITNWNIAFWDEIEKEDYKEESKLSNFSKIIEKVGGVRIEIYSIQYYVGIYCE